MSGPSSAPHARLGALVARCALCERGDVPPGRLGLTTLPAHSSLICVCRLCWLCVTVRELATGGDVDAGTLSEVEAILEVVYQRLRGELEAVHAAAPRNQ